MDLTKWPYQKKAMRELLQETRDQTDALHRYNAQQAWQNSRVSDVTSTQRQAAFGAQQKAAREHLTALEQERLAWREEQQRILEEQAAELEAQQAEAAALTGGGQVPGVAPSMAHSQFGHPAPSNFVPTAASNFVPPPRVPSAHLAAQPFPPPPNPAPSQFPGPHFPPPSQPVASSQHGGRRRHRVHGSRSASRYGGQQSQYGGGY